MILQNVIQSLLLKQVSGDVAVEISGVEMDSRQVKPGNLFIAVRGFTVDGHRYISQAVQRGAVAILVEEMVEVPSHITVVQVPDTRRAMAIVADIYYGHPTHELKLIGITGTNGKTTTSTLLQHLFLDHEKKSGLIGTIGMKIGDRELPTSNTTPEILELQKSFRMMRNEGCEYSFIEVSSHALDQGRTRGCKFHMGVFTNLTQDHLDYHETMEQYREAKGLLFNQLANQYLASADEQCYAVLNADDPASSYYARITPAQVVTYGVDQPADVKASNIRITPQGTSFDLHTFRGNGSVNIKLMGKFNVLNMLAAISVGLIEDLSLEQIINSLEQIPGVDGRFEPVHADQDYTVVVDYAHTPDSLENALKTVREFASKRVITLVGCGGDRDRTKRPLMAKIAADYSDIAIYTSDNPRTEQPEAILEDMLSGVKSVKAEKIHTIVDRAEAIRYAIEHAQSGDVILIAGKGHETYQEINGVKNDFDDRVIARRFMLEDLK
ncbi:UDP-N-acetylmuramoylalanyl-D-glutamate--2,6-diaminopimelate ligase [Thermoactinomyces sp. DSM 45891]|uniref:UDP-N-acetylmuramoyl-L-alanyl-D-glutamate--2, 6-diaminopimelate ligase n=1 Tax=Thermoactinomyces sp. DSM 45891 TaxID=1761907 RepID=UPI0009207E4F|nr:UDP-N-acetylmuramoyl-L-alanyl-D-glutamate--2,6-diaminopimelate ligase [Thermoactinomyces sp. DSM 45891]SFX27002.1 UDP-N-acetylmuramoylalanyl-D-glutamate--2,6-diaminopimelate ligase [Thermoactinomyces sp. DSM 45891]